MLGGNMGDGAKNVLNASGIEVIRGCSGPVREVAEAWLRGELKDNQIACDHHDCGHH
jgi:predicted Fe-Mo cluster-binding NifX family protein